MRKPKKGFKKDSALAQRALLSERDRSLREERSKLQGRIIEIAAELALIGEQMETLFPKAIDEQHEQHIPKSIRRVVYKTKSTAKAEND